MNPLLIGALIGAGAGVLKGMDDQKQARSAQAQWARDKAESNRLNSVKSRYSQWTGHRPQDFTRAKPMTPTLLGPIMQGMMTGAMMGQNWQGAQGPATDGVQPNAYTKGYLERADADPTGGYGYIPGAR